MPISGIPRSQAIPGFSFTKDQLAVQIAFIDFHSPDGV